MHHKFTRAGQVGGSKPVFKFEHVFLIDVSLVVYVCHDLQFSVFNTEVENITFGSWEEFIGQAFLQEGTVGDLVPVCRLFSQKDCVVLCRVEVRGPLLCDVVALCRFFITLGLCFRDKGLLFPFGRQPDCLVVFCAAIVQFEFHLTLLL